MGYQDNCGICGESYDNDNLSAPCTGCGREVCYRCGSNHRGLCQRCGDARDAAAAAAPAAPPAVAPSAPAPPPAAAAEVQPPDPPAPLATLQGDPPAPAASPTAMQRLAPAGQLWCRGSLAGLGLLMLLSYGTSAQELVLLGAAVGTPVLLALHWLFRRHHRDAFSIQYMLALMMAFFGYVALPSAAQTGWRPWVSPAYLLLASTTGLLCWGVWFRQDLRSA